MTAQPTVAAIVPVFNARHYIAETMQSILRQHPAPDEVILVDDGGTDGSIDIARAACPAAVVLPTTGRVGPAAARNLAVTATSADWLAFCDHDDIWPVGRMAALLDASDGSDWVAGRLQLSVEPGYRPDDTILRADGTHVPFMVSASLIRLDLWNRVGGMDPALRGGDDTDLYLRAREAGAVVRLVEHTTLVYRLHASSLTAVERQSVAAATLSVMRAATRRRRAAASGQEPSGG